MHCTNHMAQLRHDYQKFTELNCEVLVMVPNGPRMIERYVSAHNSPYPILSDKGSVVAGLYLQVKRFFKIGAPTVVLVDQQGKVAYTHYATSLIAEPDNNEPLAVLSSMSSVS